MEPLTTAGVLAASRSLDDAWLPSDIERIRTEDYLLLHRPAYLTAPSSCRVQVALKWLAEHDPPGIAIRLVSDEATFAALAGVETAGWGWPPRPPDVLAKGWEEVRHDLTSSSKFALLATADGTPASVGRCVVRGPVVRLFGAVTLPGFQRRGLYRSLLAARCRLAREHGATVALTKGRLETSAPILERPGFRCYAVERCWRLAVDRS